MPRHDQAVCVVIKLSVVDLLGQEDVVVFLVGPRQLIGTEIGVSSLCCLLKDHLAADHRLSIIESVLFKTLVPLLLEGLE